MLISHRKQFIYTKTVKTAGTSVEVYFEPWCLPENTWTFSHARDQSVCADGIIGYRGNHRGEASWWNHMPASLVAAQLGADRWQRYFKFCVIRNPFDKAVSAFHFSFLRHQRPADPRQPAPTDLAAGPGQLCPLFKQWIRDGGLPIDRDAYMLDGKICMDYFIRHENLEEGVKAICDRLGLDFVAERIPRLKAGMRPPLPFRQYFDEEAVEMVRAAYQFEIDRFGYESPL